MGLGGSLLSSPFSLGGFILPVWSSLVFSLSGADLTTSSRDGPGLAQNNLSYPMAIPSHGPSHGHSSCFEDRPMTEFRPMIDTESQKNPESSSLSHWKEQRNVESQELLATKLRF